MREHAVRDQAVNLVHEKQCWRQPSREGEGPPHRRGEGVVERGLVMQLGCCKGVGSWGERGRGGAENPGNYGIEP